MIITGLNISISLETQYRFIQVVEEQMLCLNLPFQPENQTKFTNPLDFYQFNASLSLEQGTPIPVQHLLVLKIMNTH